MCARALVRARARARVRVRALHADFVECAVAFAFAGVLRMRDGMSLYAPIHIAGR